MAVGTAATEYRGLETEELVEKLGEAKEGSADDMDLEDGDALAEFFSAAPTAAPAAATTTTPSVQPIHSMMLVVLNQVADQGTAQRGGGCLVHAAAERLQLTVLGYNNERWRRY